MSVSTNNALKALLNSPTQRPPYSKAGASPLGSTQGSVLCSSWIEAGSPAAATAPTAAATCDRTTLGAIGQSNKSGVGVEQRLCLKRFDISPSNSTGQPANGLLMLVDRLAHMGGLDGTNTGAQTAGLTLPARYTSGVDVWAAVEGYVAWGATLTTCKISYTNTVPTAGQVSPDIAIGGNGLDNAARILPISLAAGDLGVTAVASLTLAATTGTVGNFGVTLYRTLDMWPVSGAFPVSLPGDVLPNLGGIPVAPDDSCLQLLHYGYSNGSTTFIGAVLNFFED